jgi:hypothetical protein
MIASSRHSRRALRRNRSTTEFIGGGRPVRCHLSTVSGLTSSRASHQRESTGTSRLPSLGWRRRQAESGPRKPRCQRCPNRLSEQGLFFTYNGSILWRTRTVARTGPRTIGGARGAALTQGPARLIWLEHDRNDGMPPSGPGAARWRLLASLVRRRARQSPRSARAGGPTGC